jgi:glycopeptide antibiotics resistance protein
LNKKLWLTLLASILVLGIATVLWPSSNEVRSVYSPAISLLIDFGLVPVNRYEVALAILEVSLNVVVFIPFSCVLYLGLKRFRLLLALALALTFSIAAELAQGSFLPDRVATASDVYANFLGAVIGVALAMLIEKLNARRRAKSRKG